MKHILITIPVFFLTLFVYTKLAGPIPLSINQTTTTKSDLFTVSGTGKATGTPDVAMITVGIQARGTTVQAAQNEGNTVINAVSENIKKLGIDPKDIKTTAYTINPTYEYTNGNQRITGYNATTNLTVTVRQLDKVNTVIDTATTHGANTVSGLTFTVEDTSKLQNEARKLAIDQAKKKAADAADVAGFRLGNIINYQESFNDGPTPRPYLMAAKGTEEDANVSTQIETGSQQIQITVTLSYEIR